MIGKLCFILSSQRLAPAASLLLVHGAGSGPWVFDSWATAFPDLVVEAVDLHDGLDVASATMNDYAASVVDSACRLPRPLALVGWSMGGLVALLAAPTIRPATIVLLEASAPAEVQGRSAAELAPGTFDPEAEYGPFPPGVRARPESRLARCERKRGISVPTSPCPVIVVAGSEFPEERGTRIADLYHGRLLSFPHLDHFGLVLDPAPRTAVAEALRGAARSSPSLSGTVRMSRPGGSP